MRRRERHNRGTSILAAFGLSLIVGSVACESIPIRAMRGARYYAEGSEALERGDSVRAVEDLERAAGLVPHASEIQNHLGLAYWAAGQEKNARFAFDRAIELDCDNRAARQNRATLDAMKRLAATMLPTLPTHPKQPEEETGRAEGGGLHGG